MSDVRAPAQPSQDSPETANDALTLAQAEGDVARTEAPEQAPRKPEPEEAVQHAAAEPEAAPAADAPPLAGFNPSVVQPISLAELEGRDPNAITIMGMPLWGAVAVGAGLVTVGVLAATDDSDEGSGGGNSAPIIISNGAGANAALNLGENTATVTTVTAGDADPNTTLTYSIIGGDDADLFEINASSGALRFKTAPDFETPTDADEDNKYVVQVQASDGDLTDTQTLTITVQNIAEITSNGGGDTAEIDVTEGVTAVTTVTTEETTQTLSYSIIGGDDADLFNINSSSGALRFLDAPDFDNPQDEGADNIYEVIIRVGSGTLFDTQTLLITVNETQAQATASDDDEPLIAKALQDSFMDAASESNASDMFAAWPADVPLSLSPMSELLPTPPIIDIG